MVVLMQFIMDKYKIKKGFIVQKIGEKIAIFDGEESALYTFNKTATFIFEKLKQGLDEKKILDLLTEKYSISREGARKDFGEFIEELEKRKIIGS